MKVSICSREKVIELINKNFPEKTAVISFSDPGAVPVNYHKKPVRLFQIAIHDADLSYLSECGLTYGTYFPEVNDLAEFIYGAKKDNLDILCQCEYGESRSSACAAAIMEHFYKKGLSIFVDYRYYPNQVVYHKVFNALECCKKRMKVYLLVWACQGCFDGDDYIGIYTNLSDLKIAYDENIKKGLERGLHLEIRVFEDVNLSKQSWNILSGETKITQFFNKNL